MAKVTTLSFTESGNAWQTFWDYNPDFAFSLKDSYFTTKNGKLWKHYDSSTVNNRGTFYGTNYESNITLIFNSDVSVSKNFKTISYDGTDGWEMDSFVSDTQGFNLDSAEAFIDTSIPVKSYSEGAYLERGVQYRAGFNKKENKYHSNLRNNSAIIRPEEVRNGASMSGIKGDVAIVKLSTDSSTQLGGQKRLFLVASEYSLSAF